MIRHAKIGDIPEIMELTKACTRRMIAQGIYQWNEHYPTKEAFEIDISRNELYINEEVGKIIGVIAITPKVDDEYLPVKWITRNENNLYIHRLAVHPNFQGKGYAQELMTFAEERAKFENYNSVRLDTFSRNTRNQKFYEKRGYVKLEDIFFPKQSEFPFHCYELVL